MDRAQIGDLIAAALDNAVDPAAYEGVLSAAALDGARHSEHHYHWMCLVCRGDIAALSLVVAAAVEPLLEQERARADAAEHELAEARARGGA